MTNHKNKKILFAASILLFGAVLYNLAWFVNRNYYTNKCSPRYEFTARNTYSYYDKSITYSIKVPDYLEFTGNYAVISDDGVCLIIWPDLLKESYTYGAQIPNEDDVIYAYVNSNAEYIHDDSLNYSNEEEKAVIRLVIKNKTVLQQLLQASDSEWDCLS
jgi:hypothetical protein